MNEGSGLKAFDKSGYGNTGTLVSTAWAIGQDGPVLDFDGATSRFDTTSGKIIIAANTSITIVASVNFHDVATNRWFVNPKTPGNDNMSSLVVGFQDNNFNCYNQGYPTGNPADTQIPATINKYQQVAYASDGTRTYGYKNGVQLVNVLGSWVPGGNITEIELGHSGSTEFDGRVEYLYIFNRVLTPTEIKKIYEKPYYLFERTAQIEAEAVTPVTVSVTRRNTSGFQPISGADRLRGFRRNAMY